MMDPNFWTQVISRLDPRDRRLRKGLSTTALTELETSLGLKLPQGYRSFLQAHDGGWIGDLKIYGSPEILRLLELGRDRFRSGPYDGTGVWKSFEAPYRRLLPIHPVSSQSVECLSLGATDPRDGALSCEDEAAIYWVRFPGQVHGASRIESMESSITSTETVTGIRDIDVDVLTWSQVIVSQDDRRQNLEDPEIEPTYVDFLDWTLDAVLEAGGRRPSPFVGGGAAAQS